MSVRVLFETHVRSDAIDELKSYLDEILPDTRAREGCQEIDASFDLDDPGSLVLVSRWDSKAHHLSYVAWRDETGVHEKIGTMLDGPLNVRWFEIYNE